MDLPKNVTQIGESNSRCRVYVEDYVVSYLKQLNGQAAKKEQAVALYGTCKTEGEVSYCFVYGAGKIEQLHKEARHLSQAQMQEINNIGRRHFPEYQFLGYRILNGEMIEGFFICEQGICRYTAGYAQFYEKNEQMLAYMLEMREEEARPEIVEQEKYDEVKRRQQERREQYQESRRSKRPEAAAAKGASKQAAARPAGQRSAHFAMQGKRSDKHPTVRPSGNAARVHQLELAAAAVFGLLCLAGIGSLRQERMEDSATSDVVDAVGMSVTTDAPTVSPGAVASSGNTWSDSLIADEGLTNALLEENAPGAAKEESPATSGEGTSQDGQTTSGEETPQDGQVTSGEETSQNGQAISGEEAQDGQTPSGEAAGGGASAENESQTEPPADGGQAVFEEVTPTLGAAVEAATPTSYIICKGDTLTGISLRYYGSAARVREICEMNHILNPDDIKVGAKILLP